MPILDPVENKATTFKLPVRDPQMPLSLGPGHAAALKSLAASPYWGDEAIWDTRANNHNSMLDRDGRVWLAATVRSAGQPGVLPRRLDASVGEAVPDRSQRPAHRHVRAEDEEVHVRGHVLRHAPRAVRLRRGRHALVERRRSGARLAEHETVPEDRRCGRVARLDRVRAGHERERQARRVCRPERSGGSHEGQARRDAVLLDHAEPGRWIDLGCGDGESRLRRARRARIPSARDRVDRGVQRAASGFRRAWRRHRRQRCRLGVAGERTHGQLRSEGNAKHRSTGRRPPAITVRKAGRSTSTPGQDSTASARTAPSRAITRGSISTTRSGSVATCRCPPAT